MIEVFARDRIVTTQKTASYAAIDAMDNLYLVIRQYFTSIDTSHGCPRILKTEPNSHTTIRRIEKIDIIATWMAPADSRLIQPRLIQQRATDLRASLLAGGKLNIQFTSKWLEWY